VKNAFNLPLAKHRALVRNMSGKSWCKVRLLLCSAQSFFRMADNDCGLHEQESTRKCEPVLAFIRCFSMKNNLALWPVRGGDLQRICRIKATITRPTTMYNCASDGADTSDDMLTSMR
jgi:hypothetical protein